MSAEYKVVNDTAYDVRTPDALVSLLEKMRMLRARCAFVYGDPETGVVWDDTPLRGRIGRSTGTYKIPLVIKTRRSMGGEALLTHCILVVKESVGGKIIYDRRAGSRKPIAPSPTREVDAWGRPTDGCPPCPSDS